MAVGAGLPLQGGSLEEAWAPWGELPNPSVCSGGHWDSSPGCQAGDIRLRDKCSPEPDSDVWLLQWRAKGRCWGN